MKAPKLPPPPPVTPPVMASGPETAQASHAAQLLERNRKGLAAMNLQQPQGQLLGSN